MNLEQFNREAEILEGKNPDLIEYTMGGLCDCPKETIQVLPMWDRYGWREICHQELEYEMAKIVGLSSVIRGDHGN